MTQNRKLAIILLLLTSLVITVLLFIVPLCTRAGNTVSDAPTYMNVCSILAKNLSREKNVGLALTLFAMVLGFGGLILTILMTPLLRTLGMARSVMAALSGILVLVPLVQLMMHRQDLLNALGIVNAEHAASAGCYMLAFLALMLVGAAATELITDAQLRRSKRIAAEKKRLAAKEKWDKLETAPKKVRQETEEITVIHTATGPVCGRISGVKGSYAGDVIELGEDEEIIFGRSPKSANVVIGKNNSDISRKHCAVRVDAASGRYLVTDYSRNGTYARTSERETEMRLTLKKATYLPKGTILRLGKRDNEYKLE